MARSLTLSWHDAGPPPRRSRRAWSAAAFGWLFCIALGFVLVPAGAAADLTIGAAASLREPVTELARRHEAETGERVRLVFAASSALAAQVRAGAPLDLLLSADAEISSRLFESGDASRPTPFASNQLVVLLAPRVSEAFETPDDLTKPALRRIAIANPAVPVGRYARAWLAREGRLDALRGRIVPTEHARATLAAVEQGHVDAAVVYATDARIARHATVALRVPPERHPPIVYAASTVARGEGGSGPAFLRRLLSPEGRAAFERAGFFANEAP